MPAKSQAQRKWAFGVMGEKWARKHHRDNRGNPPARKAKKKGNLDAAADRAYARMHRKSKRRMHA